MRDVGSGLVLVLVAFAYLLGAWDLPAGQGEPGPSFFPFLLAGVLFGLAVTIVVRGIGDRRPSSGERQGRVAILVIVLTILYAFALTRVGFIASTLAYTALVVLLLGARGVRVLLVPLASVALIYAAFALGLGVPLP